MRTDYPIENVADGVYKISDFGMANCYLVVGEERALLIDCGLGVGDLKGAVERITNKPLYVVATHGHVDHMGGDGQFERVYVHAGDVGRVYRFMTSYALRALFLLMSKGNVDKSIRLRDVVKYKNRPEIVPIADGHLFKLGGRTVKVEHSVGHTYGSILLFDDKTDIVFVGDNMCPSPWLFLPNTSYVDEWLVSAKRILEISETHPIWWGHEGGSLTCELIANVVKIGESCLKKYKKNAKIGRIVAYPTNDRVNGSLVVRTGHIHSK